MGGGSEIERYSGRGNDGVSVEASEGATDSRVIWLGILNARLGLFLGL